MSGPVKAPRKALPKAAKASAEARRAQACAEATEARQRELERFAKLGITQVMADSPRWALIDRFGVSVYGGGADVSTASPDAGRLLFIHPAIKAWKANPKRYTGITFVDLTPAEREQGEVGCDDVALSIGLWTRGMFRWAEDKVDDPAGEDGMDDDDRSEDPRFDQFFTEEQALSANPEAAFDADWERAKARVSRERAANEPPAGLSVAEAVREKIAQRLARSASAMLTEQEVRFYVDGLIGEQLAGGLVSQGGVGKTSLLIGLGIATAIGGDWLGRAVKQGSFVLFSLDDAQEDLDGALARAVKAQDLTAAQIELVRRHVILLSLRDVDGELKFAVTSPKGAVEATALAQDLLDGLDGIADVRCIVLDTLRQFAGGTTNDDRVMTIATKAVTRMAQRLGCAAIVPAHTTKAGAREGVSDQYAASGSGAFGDNLRFILTLQQVDRAEVEKELHLDVGGQMQIAVGSQLLRMDDTRGSLLRIATGATYIVRDGFKFSALTGQAKTTHEKQAEANLGILRAVAGGAASVEAVRAVAGGRKADITAAVTVLVAQGLLKRGEKGRGVFITDAGKARLE